MVNASASLPDFTGKTIDGGRIKLLEVIGTGAYGVVYGALDTRPSVRPGGKRYAVKCLQRDLPPKQRRFQARELALHAVASDHPNVLTLHGVIEEEHYVYLVLDLCPGGDLFGAITERHVYHRNDALLKKAFLQLLDAVQWCHDRGIFHRDLKPENILCSEDGSRLYLSDFGLATKEPVSRDFGCGSSYYMSPECIGKEFDLGAYSTRHSDIWSLGIILTNMITGRNPWRWATTDDECFSAYLHNRDFLQEMLPISKGTNRILRRIFTLNPHSRITIPDLREAVLKMDSFWMSRADTARASEHVRIADESYAVKPPIAELAGPPTRALPDDSTLPGQSTDSSSDFSDETLPPVSEGPFRHGHTVSSPPRALIGRIASDTAAPQTLPPFVSGSESDSEASSSSGEESEGPITPETHANDPAVEVPDMPEGEGMGELVVVPVRQQERGAGKQQVKSPVTSPSHLFKHAVQRLKALHA